jgi:MFS family permease
MNLTGRAAAVIVTMNLAQLPVAMRQLLVVLLAHDNTGSFTVAGLAGAACGLGLAVTSPLFGRLLGRHRPRPILLATGVAHLAALVALTFSTDPATFVALAAAAGLGTPPVLSSGRALLPALVAPSALARAYAANAVGQELLYVGGPVAVTVSLALGGPGGAMLAFAAIGTVALIANAAVVPASGIADADGDGGDVDRPATRTLLGVYLGYMVCMGAMWVLVPAFAAGMGRPAWAGLLVTVWSAGSLVGGLLLTARGRRGDVSSSYLLLLGGLAVTALALPLPRTMPQMIVALALFGLPLAPWLAVADELGSRAAPAPHTAAFFGWQQTAGQVGIAIGAGVSGPVVGWAGTTVGFLLVPFALAVALALAVRMRGRLAAAAGRGVGSGDPDRVPSAPT